MLKSSFLISFIFIFALCPQVVLGILDAAIWDPIKEKLSKDRTFNEYIPEIQDTLTFSKAFKSYPVKEYLGSDSRGVLFDVESKDNNLIAKILITGDDKVENCNDNGILTKLKGRGVRNFIGIKGYERYFTRVSKMIFGSETMRAFNGCILILEKAETDLKVEKIFEEDSKENWPVLFRFFGKLIQSFAEINFRGKVLHGDIKPKSIKVKVSKKGNPLELDVEPVVIDFYFGLENEKGEDFSDKQLRYTEGYRPEEMIEATSEKNLGTTQAWNKNWKKYKYSGEFLEDSYALGVTILEVLKLQSKNVRTHSNEYGNFIILVKQMAGPRFIYDKERVTSENPKGYVKLRPNTKEALARFLKIVESNSEYMKSKLTTEFFKSAKASLEEMNKIIIKI